MAQKGQETEEATKLLWNYMQTLQRYREHRQIIFDEIARQEAPIPEDPSDP